MERSVSFGSIVSFTIMALCIGAPALSLLLVDVARLPAAAVRLWQSTPARALGCSPKSWPPKQIPGAGHKTAEIALY